MNYLITLQVTRMAADDGEMRLETADRKLARAMQLLAIENDLDCEVLIEQKPKVVKFKGIELEGGK